MRTGQAIGWVLVAAAVAAAVATTHMGRPETADASDPGTVVGPSVTVLGGSAEQLELARWAVSRFEAASLQLPPVEIRFHDERSGCGEHFGYYRAGVVDVCGSNVNLLARRNLLHELVHAWAEVNVTRERRERFLELRGLRTWNGRDVGWRERGFEHAAEILAWHLGDRILTPTLPDVEPERIEEAVAVLTAR